MVVIQKIDHRKRDERKLFFSLKIIPFFVLFIMIMLLIFDNSLVQKKDLSGNVVNNIVLTENQYDSEDSLEGSVKLIFNQNDFLPSNTSILINLAAKCPAYYVCNDGSEILWVDENCTLIQDEPWTTCDDGAKNIYNCTGSGGHGKTCCAGSGVDGKNYLNLRCPNVPSYLSDDGTGFCGDSCTSSFKKDLSYFISKSGSSGKGNFTESVYKNNGNAAPFSGASGPGVGYCSDTNVSYIPFVSTTCNDSDGNASWIKNTCYDMAGAHEDFCTGTDLWERYCRQDLVNIDYNCSACSIPFCAYPKTDSEGWYTNCSIGGLLIKKRITYATCDGLNPNLYGPQCLAEKMMWALMPYCANKGIPCGTCSNGACSSSNSNCSGWSPANVYESSFSNLGIHAPSESGTYFLILALSWNNGVFNSTYSELVVSSGSPRHRECVDNVCRLVDGSGDNQCNSNADCSNNGCTPSWSCTGFGSCVNGQQFRTCSDLNSCGTSTGKPSEQQSCSCSSIWNCAWQVCSAGSTQNKICSDSMNCNPNNLSYISETRDCCVEGWDCGKWSECLNGVQTKTCTETTSCGTSFDKPAEQKSCKSGGSFPWLIVIIVVFVIVVGFLIWLFLSKRRMTRDRFVGGNDFGSYEPSNPYNPSDSSSEPTSFEPRNEPQESARQTRQFEPRQTRQPIRQSTKPVSRPTTKQPSSSSDSDYGPSLSSRSYPSEVRSERLEPRKRVVRRKAKSGKSASADFEYIPDAPDS